MLPGSYWSASAAGAQRLTPAEFDHIERNEGQVTLAFSIFRSSESQIRPGPDQLHRRPWRHRANQIPDAGIHLVAKRRRVDIEEVGNTARGLMLPPLPFRQVHTGQVQWRCGRVNRMHDGDSLTEGEGIGGHRQRNKELFRFVVMQLETYAMLIGT